MPTIGLVEVDGAGRAVEGGVAEGEDAAVGRDEPEARAAIGVPSPPTIGRGERARAELRRRRVAVLAIAPVAVASQ